MNEEQIQLRFDTLTRNFTTAYGNLQAEKSLLEANLQESLIKIAKLEEEKVELREKLD